MRRARTTSRTRRLPSTTRLSTAAPAPASRSRSIRRGKALPGQVVGRLSGSVPAHLISDPPHQPLASGHADALVAPAPYPCAGPAELALDDVLRHFRAA